MPPGGTLVEGRTASPRAPSLQVRVLGHFDVRIDGKTLLPLRTRTEAALLAFLVVKARVPVDRERAAAAIWPESERANTWLTEALSRLRSCLGPHRGRLQAPTRASLQFDAVGADIDLDTFEQGLAAGDTSGLESAAHAYGGPLLDGFLDDWVAPLRTDLEDRFVECLEDLAGRALRNADALTAVRHLRRAAAASPLNERVHAALVRALYAAGDRAAARRALAAAEQQLRAEGIELDASLAALGDGGRLEPHALPAGPAGLAPHPLPSPLSDLVGRGHDLAEVEARLEGHRLVSLTGPGGVGKTRLALEAARRALEAGADATAFAALDAVDRDDLVLPTVCSAFAHHVPPGVAPLDSLAARIGTNKALLVLDNCEHLAGASARAASELLSRCGNLRILATGRQPLGVAGEVVLRVDPLAVEGDAVAMPTMGPAVALFVARARDAGCCLAANPSDMPVAASICRQLDGLPLALELAAARLRVVSLRSLEKAVARDAGFIRADAWAPGRHRSLDALMEWGHSLLADEERALLGCLSVFRGPFTVCAAAHVFDADDARVLRLVASLAEKSLLTPAPYPGDDDGYRMLDTIRRFAASRVHAPGQPGAWQVRHLDYYRVLAARAAATYNGSGEAAWLRRIDSERGNIASALDFSVGSADTLPAGLALAASMRPYWEMRGMTPQGRAFYDRALAAARCAGLAACEADALLGLAAIAMAQGDGRARQLLVRCLALREGEGPSPAVSEVLLHLARIAASQGDYPMARANAARALELSRELGDEQGCAEAHLLLGRIAHSLGQHEETLAIDREALAVYSRLGDACGEAVALLNLARAAGALGRSEEGQDLMRRGMTMLRRVGAARSLAVWLIVQGDLLRAHGDLPAATRAYEESHAIFRAQGNLRGAAWALTVLGNAAGDSGRSREAHELAAEALRLRVSICDLRGIAETLGAMAEMAVSAAGQAGGEDEGRLWERAAVLYGAAESICRAIETHAYGERRREYDALVQRTVAHAGGRAAWQRGVEMPLGEAVEYALAGAGK